MSDDNGALERIKQDLLDLADYVYGRLRARLQGLTDGEYLWEPVEGCWSVRAVGDGAFRSDGSPVPIGPAPLTTIAWRMCHIIDLLSAERNATWIGVRPVAPLNRVGEPGTAPDGIEQFERAYSMFRSTVAATEVAALTRPMGPVAGPYAATTRTAFILHELDELIHHAAEVATPRDLCRATRLSEETGATYAYLVPGETRTLDGD